MAIVRLGIGFNVEQMQRLNDLCKLLSPNGVKVSKAAALHYAVEQALKARKKAKEGK